MLLLASNKDCAERFHVLQERRVSPLEAGGTLKGAEAAGKVSLR